MSLSVPKLQKTIAFGDVNKKTLEKRNRKEKEKSEKTLTVFLFHFEFERRFSFAFSLFFFVHVFCVVTDCFFQICKKAAMTTYQSLALGFFIAIGLVVSVCGERFEVTSAQQLIELLDLSKANNFDAKITLLDDLDFSFSPLTLPFGVSSDGSCVSYTGVFEGNGHTIKGLVMNNKDNQEYDSAGLFCALGNATFENLVIDSSCSFSGNYAGALCVSVKGSLVVRNVTNMASVSGTRMIGGFVGWIGGLNKGVEVTFKDCVNDGTVTGSDYNVGGFIGYIYNNTNMNVTISNSTNNGSVTGSDYNVGGFVGIIHSNTNMNVTISNSISNGNVTGSNSDVGGFVGYILSNTNMTMTISNSISNGSVTGSMFVGGFIGYIYSSTNMAMTISNSTNNGTVAGSREYVGGFVGCIFSLKPKSISLFITSSANKGNVSAKYGMACGVFCVDSNNNYNVKSVLTNSINKGSVDAGTNAYGIANIITKARNVVSMGEVTGSSGSFTFWESSTDVGLFFGLKSKCKNCTTNATLFEHNTNTGFYEVVGSGEHVHELLNAEVEKQNYGMFWTKELDLEESLVEPSPSPSPLSSSLPSPSPSLLSSTSSQSGGLSGGNKHGVSLFWIGVVVALAAHVAMAQ